MIKLRFLAPLALVLAVAAWSSAHELKVLASRLADLEPGNRTTIYLSWGHRLPVDDLVDAESVERYDLIAPGGKSVALKKADLSMQANVVELSDGGIHQVVACRKPSVFTYVIDSEGNRLLKRGPKTAVKEGKIDQATRSQQCAKALVVVGKPGREAVKPVGLPIEIVPLDAPASWTASTSLRFQVLLDGKPLPSAEVTARYLGFKPDSAWCYATSSGREGVATVRPGQPGTWVLKVSGKRPAPAGLREQYDVESFTATLALEIQP